MCTNLRHFARYFTHCFFTENLHLDRNLLELWRWRARWSLHKFMFQLYELYFPRNGWLSSQNQLETVNLLQKARWFVLKVVKSLLVLLGATLTKSCDFSSKNIVFWHFGLVRPPHFSFYFCPRVFLFRINFCRRQSTSPATFFCSIGNFCFAVFYFAKKSGFSPSRFWVLCRLLWERTSFVCNLLKKR
jgi:hypothetical protein